MTENTDNPYYSLFLKQKSNQFNIANSTYSQRITKLNALQRAIEITYRDKIQEALYKDLRRPLVESDLVAVYLVIKEIKHAKTNLHRWLKKQKVKSQITLLGTSSWISYEPKGVCLIISPWNYPINLALSPLVAAIAAGNSVIIKPSEIAKHSSTLLVELISSLYKEDEVAVIKGGVETAQHLLKLPFNHIFFTGSIPVGKIVMEAAAKHLTSVTLELGGKSPVIIDQSANLKQAAEAVVWIKHFNCGQTCIAPDFIFIHESIKQEFLEHYKRVLVRYYGEDASKSETYGRIINNKNFKRLELYLEDAKSKNAHFEVQGLKNEQDKFIGPTVISDLPEDSLLLKEEIFGPILPIKTFNQLDEVTDYLKSKEKPLALYIYAKNRKTIDLLIKNTRAGGTGINNNGLHFSNHNLPFGGSNSSGIGKAHGFYSFKEFSNVRSILKRYSIGPIRLLYPPYTSFKELIARITVKWL
ncbi:MAG: aldehyde dehydrogenase family protein [Winogradskyella sp.]|nr:MAG: aldehyde dehydrogenase family protein [Winogradskyella sp.]